MKINLKQSEIEEAIVAHLQSNGLKLDGRAITIKFKAGRKGNGLSTVVEIEGDEEVEVVAPQEAESQADVDDTADVSPSDESEPVTENESPVLETPQVFTAEEVAFSHPSPEKAKTMSLFS